MRKIDFVLYYEHWKRELYGLTIIRVELENRGYSVRIANEPNEKEFDFYRYFYQPEVVLYPWAYSNSDICKINSFKKPIEKIVNMQCEQILSSRSLKNNFFSIKGEARLAYHVSWGKVSYDRFVKDGVNENKILEVGNLNLDINSEKFSGVLHDKDEIADEYNLDKNKKWVMLFSDFKFSLLSVEKLMLLDKRSKGIRDLNRIMSISKRIILKWIRKFLNENKDTIIIYRAHPIEHNDIKIKRMENEFENFKYISDETIQQWIKVCDKFIAWNSSSTIDVKFLDKPISIVRPFKLDNFYSSEVIDLNSIISNYNEFEKFLNEDVKMSCISDEVFENYIYNKKDIFTYTKLCDELEKIYKAKLGVKYTSRYIYNKGKMLKSLVLCIFLWSAKYINYKFIKFSSCIEFIKLCTEKYKLNKIENELYIKIKNII